MLKFLYETQDVKLFDSPNDTGLPGGEGRVNENPSADLLLLKDS